MIAHYTVLWYHYFIVKYNFIHLYQTHFYVFFMRKLKLYIQSCSLYLLSDFQRSSAKYLEYKHCVQLLWMMSHDTINRQPITAVIINSNYMYVLFLICTSEIHCVWFFIIIFYLISEQYVYVCMYYKISYDKWQWGVECMK